MKEGGETECAWTTTVTRVGLLGPLRGVEVLGSKLVWTSQEESGLILGIKLV